MCYIIYGIDFFLSVHRRQSNFFFKNPEKNSRLSIVSCPSTRRYYLQNPSVHQTVAMYFAYVFL